MDLPISLGAGLGVCHCPPPAGGSGFLLRDRFPDGDGTNLSGKALEVGGTWAVSGTWNVTNNQARKTASAATWEYATADAGSATVDVRVTCVTANVNGGAVARYTDDDNNWSIRVASGTTLELYEKNAGSFTLRGSAAVSPGATHTARLVCSGTTITAYIDATSVIYGSATFNQTATRCGVWQNSAGANDQFDDFQVT